MSIEPRNSETVEQAWERVARDAGWIRRLVFARMRGYGLDAIEEVVQDLSLDLVESRHLWDPRRGSWRLWARTRQRLAQVRWERQRARHEPVGRGSVAAERHDEDPGVVIPSVGVGGRGNQERTEAAIDVVLVFRRLSAEQQDVVRGEFLGLVRVPPATREERREERRGLVARAQGRRYRVAAPSGLYVHRGTRGWGWTDVATDATITARDALLATRELDPSGDRGLRIEVL